MFLPAALTIKQKSTIMQDVMEGKFEKQHGKFWDYNKECQNFLELLPNFVIMLQKLLCYLKKID